MPREHHFHHHKHEALSPPTVASITKYYGGLVNNGLRSICTIYIYLVGEHCGHVTWSELVVVMQAQELH
jgi:hypothetical protein